MIKYDPAKRVYFVRDLREGTGTFVRVASKAALGNNEVISLGELHLAVFFPAAKAPQDLNSLTCADALSPPVKPGRTANSAPVGSSDCSFKKAEPRLQ